MQRYRFTVRRVDRDNAYKKGHPKVAFFMLKNA
jgi:hypothetical protein